MGYYFAYYVALMVATAIAKYPPLLVGVVVVFLLRRWLPDPAVLWRTMGRIDSLSRQIEANPANVTARRDLAAVYIDRLRPKRALELLAEARERFPDDAELLFLTGLAHLRRGEPALALAPLVRCVELDPRVRFGAPYLVAGDALRELGRHDEAIDAYERWLESSSSSIEGHVKVALAHRGKREHEQANAALREAHATWKELPQFKRREELGWWLYAWVLKVI